MAREKHVNATTEEAKAAIIENSVLGESIPINPVGNATELKQRFVNPIVNDEGKDSAIAEVDRVAAETEAALDEIDENLVAVAKSVSEIGGELEELEELDEDVTKLQKDVQDLDENKVNKSGDTMNGPLTFEEQGGPAKTEVSEQGVFVTNDGENGTAYNDGAIVNQGKRIVIPLKDGTVALAENVVASVELQLFELDYKLTLRARAADTRILSESTIDLPLESMVVGGEYNDETKKIDLTLQNGNVVSFPVDELVNGLISSSEKGAPNGVASLDADGKVPKEQLPDDIGGGASEEAIEEAIAKVHKSYIASDDFSLSVATLRLIVNDVQYNGATVYIKTAGYYPIIFSVEEATHIGVTATLHSYDSGRYRLRVLTYSFDPSVDDSVIITPEGTLKTLVSTTDYAKNETGKAGVVLLGAKNHTGLTETNNVLGLTGSTHSVRQNPKSYHVAVMSDELYSWIKYGIVDNDETLTDEEKTSACEWLGAAKETDVELLTKTVFQSGLAYQVDETEAWSERTTANGLNVVDGSKAILKKVVGNTVACRNLFDIPNIDATMGNSSITLKVNITQNIFVSAGELATVSSSTWRFHFVLKDGTDLYATDIELASGGKKISATADNPIVEVIYRGTYITDGQYSKIMIAYGDTVTEYQPYFTGLKSASFAGLESTNANGTETSTLAFPKTETPLGVTIDFENKKITDYGVDLVLTGAEEIDYYPYQNTRNCVTFKTPNYQVANDIYSDGYVSTDSVRTGKVSNNVFLFFSLSLCWLDILDTLGYTTAGTLLTTAEEQEAAIANLKAWLAQRYADGNPVTIRYVSSVLQSETDFTAGNEYTAYKGGTEKVLENDGAEYGADNTQTVNYIFVKEA